MENNTEFFCTLTLIISWILGKISKKAPGIDNYFIPIQNMLIGIVIAIVEWFITRDFKVAVALTGTLAGGMYDVLHNLNIILKKKLKKEN